MRRIFWPVHKPPRKGAIMSIDYLAHDLFLLMITLSQIKSEARILTVFLEAMNNIQPNIHLRLLSEGEEVRTETVELATTNNSFGYIVLEGTLDEQPHEILSLMRNAIRMLAVILEKRFHETLIEDKDLRLETAVTDRTAELLQANKLLKNEIAERRQVEEALRESEEKFRSLFDNINIGVAVHEIITDENNKAIDFIFLDANPAYEHLTQLKAADIVGKRGLEAIPNLEQRWIDIYGEVARTEKATTIIDHSDYLDKYWEVKAYSPKKNQFAVALSDITERKQAEDALRENEKLLRQIAANYPNSYLSIIEKDFTAGFTSGQEFQKQNLDPEQFIGLTLEQIFGDKAPLIKEYYQKTFNGAEQTFELFINNQYQ
jgi:PAS domain S-box-containing protein